MKYLLRLPVKIFRFPLAAIDHTRHWLQVRRVFPDQPRPAYKSLLKSVWRSL